MLLVALALAVRVGCGRAPTAPVSSARGPAGPSSGEGGVSGEMLAAGRAPEPLGARLTSIAGSLVDQDGRTRTLAEWRGSPFIASPIYTRCPLVCPRVVGELKRLERDLPAGEAPHVLLLSLDPANDTPEALRAFAAEHVLERTHWALLAPDTSMLAAITAALGVAWRSEGGAIGHSAVVAIVDGAGRIRRRFVGLEADPAALAAAWREARLARASEPD